MTTGATPSAARPLSSRNPRLRRLARLARKRSERTGEAAFVVEGPKLLAEAVAAGAPVESVFVAAGLAGLDDVLARAASAGAAVWQVEPEALARAVDVVSPQPVAAVVGRPVAAAVPPGATFVVVLVDVADPGNAGTLLRTAEAAGADAVVVCGEAVDPWSPKAVRASAGTVFRLPVVDGGDPRAVLADLGGRGLRRVGTRVAAGRPYDEVDLRGPVAVVLGSEAHGLPAALDHLVDEPVTIPMAGRVESLNVAAAGAVLCFEVLRQRRRSSAGVPPGRVV